MDNFLTDDGQIGWLWPWRRPCCDVVVMIAMITLQHDLPFLLRRLREKIRVLISTGSTVVVRSKQQQRTVFFGAVGSLFPFRCESC